MIPFPYMMPIPKYCHFSSVRSTSASVSLQQFGNPYTDAFLRRLDFPVRDKRVPRRHGVDIGFGSRIRISFTPPARRTMALRSAAQCTLATPVAVLQARETAST